MSEQADVQCCDLHGRNCEPPSELCCYECTEAAHSEHADGSTCSNPDLSARVIALAERVGTPLADWQQQHVMSRLTPPMAMQISRAEQDYHAMLRLRSWQLAIQRGHIRG